MGEWSLTRNLDGDLKFDSESVKQQRNGKAVPKKKSITIISALQPCLHCDIERYASLVFRQSLWHSFITSAQPRLSWLPQGRAQERVPLIATLCALPSQHKDSAPQCPESHPCLFQSYFPWQPVNHRSQRSYPYLSSFFNQSMCSALCSKKIPFIGVF